MERKVIIIDSCIWIDFFRENEEIADEILSLPKSLRFIASVSLMEVFEAGRSRGKGEIEKIKKVLKEMGVKIKYSSRKDSKIALFLMEKYTPKYGLSVKDALIAATVVSSKALFWTRDKIFKHIEEIQLYKPESQAWSY